MNLELFQARANTRTHRNVGLQAMKLFSIDFIFKTLCEIKILLIFNVIKSIILFVKTLKKFLLEKTSTLKFGSRDLNSCDV